jgi:hypothetical protein
LAHAIYPPAGSGGQTELTNAEDEDPLFVKGNPRLAREPLVTMRGPEGVPAGNANVMLVSLQVEDEIPVPLMVSVPDPWLVPKPTPDTVIHSVSRAGFGLTDVMVGRAPEELYSCPML